MNDDTKVMTRQALIRKAATVAILAPAAFLAACATQPEPPPPAQPAPPPPPAPRARG
jgi:hypothetical protein